jgi:hypothetical protein
MGCFIFGKAPTLRARCMAFSSQQNNTVFKYCIGQVIYCILFIFLIILQSEK